MKKLLGFKVGLIFFLFVNISLYPEYIQASNHRDSLLYLLNKHQEIDTARINLLIEIGQDYINSDTSKAKEFLNQALQESIKIEFEKGEAEVYYNLGQLYSLPGSYDMAIDNFQKATRIFKNTGDKLSEAVCYYHIGYIYFAQNIYDDAIENFQRALKRYQTVNDTSNIAECFRMIGITYNYKGNYDQSLEKYLGALRLFEEIKDSISIAKCYTDIGILNYDLENFDKSIEYLQKSLEIKESLSDKRGVSNCYLNMGVISNDQGNHDQAIGYFLSALKTFIELDDKYGISACYTNIGVSNSDKGNITDAKKYYLKAIEIDKELGDKSGMAVLNNNIANLHFFIADSLILSNIQKSVAIKHLDSAMYFGKNSLALSKEIGSFSYQSSNLELLMNASYKKQEYKKSLEYAYDLLAIKDSLFNTEKTNAIQEMETKYETEKKQQQIELQESQLIIKEAKIKQQTIFRNLLITILGAVIVIICLVIYAYVQKRKDNQKIREQNEFILDANEELKQLNEEITTQKEEIESQRDHVMRQKEEITDSINYAQKIQSAILPPETYITELLQDNFILYKPRDIVSGDFYWAKQINEYVIIVAADCTGHGVPGAFMSMLGISFLNEIVQRREITKANEVLNELRKQIKQSLRQHGDTEESKDGMDMAFLALNTKTNMVQYAGANNPLYLFRDQDGESKLIEIQADKMPVGIHFGKERSFTNQEIQLEIGDTLYIFSDGYPDQIGGAKGKKFMKKNFKSLLADIQDKSMKEQKNILDDTLMDWKQDYEQVDDILVIGIRIN